MASVATGVEGPVVSPQWVVDNLSKVKVLDSSWYMPFEKRDSKKEFEECRITGANFFDIDAISDPNTSLPHMLPTEAAFSAAASALGLTNDDAIVVYDGKGIFGAARAWWMFRAFGHSQVWVMEGGFPLYRQLSLPCVEGSAEKEVERARKAAEAVKSVYASDGQPAVTEAGEGGFKAKLQPHLVRSYEQVLDNISKQKEGSGFQVVDARAGGRFTGKDPEPRPGISSGHIPESFNVPFPQVLSPEGRLRSSEELQAVFKGAGLTLDEGKPIVASCGTGVTACILALALHKLGRADVPVYDGSWTEWASRSDANLIQRSA
eukprot:TRINITY_DN2424_c0_g2_i1.p1 TRINITY_DN2424_c0_g2~~TRINITY_DN2424_c0_g2_i1.p1  ORF type:complete len:320 (-),score=60.04 TRINITY_DN2424_c0_g2_i1:400-1359(-)